MRSPTQILPPVITSKPAINRSRVLLPQPEGPTSTINSPSAIVRLMRRKTLILSARSGSLFLPEDKGDGAGEAIPSPLRGGKLL